MAYEPERTRYGWRLETPDGLTVDAESPHFDRGAIRAALSVRDSSGVILWRDTANLTSDRARSKIVSKLSEKDVTLDERVIIALDEACRTRSTADEKRERDGSTNTSDAPPLDLDQLRDVFKRWLLIRDRALLSIFTGAVLAHRQSSDPVWLLIVAPPGGIKSELLRTLYGYDGIYPLSDLTARTFASGLDSAAGDPSLLARLNNEILVLKDFTTVLEMYREERQAILAQLREIYDGRFDKAWGTGRELHWEGRIGFIAGVTPIIDHHQAAMSVLGERFVTFRLSMPDRTKLATQALKAAGSEVVMRNELTRAMHGFLNARTVEQVSVTEDDLHAVATVADFITRARSGVVRDGYRRELEYAPEPEAPTRFAKVLLSLARGIAIAHDSETVTDRELRLVLRVALDCLPVIRRRVIAALVESTIAADTDGLPSTSDITGAAQFSTAAIRRSLEDLQALGVVICHKTGKGKADRWELPEVYAEVFGRLTSASDEKSSCDGYPDKSEQLSDELTYSETSEPPPHKTNGHEPDVIAAAESVLASGDLDPALRQRIEADLRDSKIGGVYGRQRRDQLAETLAGIGAAR